MLAKDGSNVVVWRESLYAYARANHHAVGREFANGKRLIRPKPTLADLKATYDELTAESLQIMLQQEIYQLVKLKRTDVDDESALFALTEQLTSDEGLARVKLLPDYAAILDDQDADGLVKLVISEHTLNEKLSMWPLCGTCVTNSSPTRQTMSTSRNSS
jgi:hypothetical protein